MFYSLLLVLLPMSNGMVLAQSAQSTPISTLNCSQLTSPLALGSTGPAVYMLQKVLNASPDTQIALAGPGSPGNETDYFGALTKTAVSKFQEKYRSEILVPASLTAGTGFVGTFTLSMLKRVCGELTASTYTQSLIPVSTQTLPTTTVSTTSVVPKAVPAVIGTTTGSQSLVATTVTSQYAGVCGTKVDTCAVGSYRSRSDTAKNYRWICTSSNGLPNTSCSLSKSVSQTPTTTPIVASPLPTPAPAPTTTTSTPTPSQPIATTTQQSTSASSLKWGVFPGYSAESLASFETLIGKPVQLRAQFVNWNSAFPTSVVSDLKAKGKTLVLFWEQYGVTLDSIISGQSDAYIAKFAADIKAYGGPVILSPFHEMNGNWDPWGGTVGQNTPAKVVAAWKRVHDVFGSVSNVQFAWTVNNISVPDTAANAISQYYPGDAYVDIVGVDGFNFGTPWQSFDQTFKPALTTVAAYNKPIYILSMASESGPNRAAWITDAVTVQMKKYPLLKGWVWFNENNLRTWSISSDSSSISAIKSVVP